MRHDHDRRARHAAHGHVAAAPRLDGDRRLAILRWLPPLLAFGAINAAAIAVFIGRPYTWVDGTTARLMW